MAANADPIATPLSVLVLRQAVLCLLAAAVLVPLIATALGGFKSLGDLRVNAFGWPAVWEWRNYWGILAGDRYWRLMGNSAVIAGLTVFLTVTVSAMAAFVFVHVRFFGSRYLFNYLLLGLMFPAATAILPLFIKVRDLGLLDTYWGVVLPQVERQEAHGQGDRDHRGERDGEDADARPQPGKVGGRGQHGRAPERLWTAIGPECICRRSMMFLRSLKPSGRVVNESLPVAPIPLWTRRKRAGRGRCRPRPSPARCPASRRYRATLGLGGPEGRRRVAVRFAKGRRSCSPGLRDPVPKARPSRDAARIVASSAVASARAGPPAPSATPISSRTRTWNGRSNQLPRRASRTAAA